MDLLLHSPPCPSSLYWYPLFIALQHIIIGIQATSGIISLDLFGMILIYLAWMAQRLGGSTALVLFSSFIISGVIMAFCSLCSYYFLSYAHKAINTGLFSSAMFI